MRQKALPFLLLFLNLTACTVIPGMHMSPLTDQSSVEMPVQESNDAILKKLDIQSITAQLIVEMEKDNNNRSAGNYNAANLYFDYRIGSRTVKGTPEPEEYKSYLVGPRDILNITVWGHPELAANSGSQNATEGSSGNVVGEDGNFYFPFAGVMRAAGRTVEDIRNELSGKLSKYIENLQLDVRVSAYRSQRVYVVGEVNQPGIQTVKDIPLSVLEAINSAGGVRQETADLRNITLTRQDKTFSINLLALYENGDISQNVILKHGDILNVPDNFLNKVFVLGETTASGTGAGRSHSILMNKGRITLAEALSDGGSINQSTGDASRIFVFRGGLNKPAIYHLDAKSPDALLLADRFSLQPHDVVYVDRTEGIRWNQIIDQIQPTITLLNAFDGSLNVKPFQ